ncbi:protein O-mannosyl-transferase TMTC1-like [Styela clava]
MVPVNELSIRKRNDRKFEYECSNDCKFGDGSEKVMAGKEEASANTTPKINSVCLLQCVGIFGVAFGIYSNTLYGDFIHDDNPAILRNPDVKGSNRLLSVFKNDFWGTPMSSNASHKSYRPICILMFRFEHYLFGYNQFFFHVTNVCLHSVVSVLFWIVCNHVVFKSKTNCKILSFVSAILFALHPIHTEAVANIVGRAELLSSLFYLLSILCYNISLKREIQHGCKITDEKGDKNGNEKNDGIRVLLNAMSCKVWLKIYFFSSLLLVTFAMLSKESGITSLGIMLVMEFIHMRGSTIKSSGKVVLHVYRAIAVICWITLLLIFRLAVMNWTQPIFAKPDNPASQSRNFMTRLLTYSYLVWINFKLLVAPVYLLYDWSYGTVPIITSIFDIRNFVTLLFGISIIIITFRIAFATWKTGIINPSCYGYLLLFIPYLPASNLFFPVGFVIAERTLYMPSMGYILLLVVFWEYIYNRFHNIHKVLKAIIISIMLLYGIRTWVRNQDWQNKETLFNSGVHTAPQNAKIRYNWGNFLRDNGRYRDAMLEYEKTLKLYPSYAGALNNLAIILEMNHSTCARAEELYVRLIRLEPNRIDSYKNLADLHMRKKRYDSAVDVYSRIFDEFGTHVAHVISFAEMLYKNNLTNQAERLLARVLSQYCTVQKDGEIINIIFKSQNFKRASSCISNTNELHTVYTLYTKIATKKLTPKELSILLERSVTLESIQYI